MLQATHGASDYLKEQTNGVFLNVSLNSLTSVTKLFVITVKGLEPAT